MAHKFNPDKMHKLDNPQRRYELPPIETLMALGLQKEDSFLDIGCGIGYFTIPAAKYLGPERKVTGVDVSERMIKELQERARQEQISHIQVVESKEYDLSVEPLSHSFALMVNVLHEIEDKTRFLIKIHEALMENGKFAIIEWAKIPMDQGPPVAHRISQLQAVELLEVNGFEVVSKHEFTDSYYGLVGVKK